MKNFPDTFTLRGPDLERAVAAGVLPGETAERLVDFVQQTSATGSEDENLRLVTGFGDIFVTIGLGLFLGALVFLSGKAWHFVLPVATWGLAEVFTRWKRMALPSIVLLLTFGTSVFLGVFGLFNNLVLSNSNESLASFSLDKPAAAVAGLATMIAIGLHWLRFRVPVTIAAAAAAGVAIITGLVGTMAPQFLNWAPVAVFLPLGLLVFSLAMFFDMSDLNRRTPKTDMAFWLHLLAAPLIVHPLVQGFANVGAMTQGDAIRVFVIFAVLGVVALIVDRRAMLVSSLLYVGYALSQFISFGAATTGNTALTVLILGTIVLALSIAWKPLRKILLSFLPANIRRIVPAANATYIKAKAV
jgi:hypothetical protein